MRRIALIAAIITGLTVHPQPKYEVARYEATGGPETRETHEVDLSLDRDIKKPTADHREPETYTVTAYCSCSKCCGVWATKRGDGPVIGAYGVELTPWYSVAAPLPYGTKLKIDGMTYEVQDTTASWIVDRYAGRIIDIYMGDSHEEAKAWGKVELEVEIVGDN